MGFKEVFAASKAPQFFDHLLAILELQKWPQKAKEQKQFRRELEQAYEREKSKSVISKRCTRIYEEHLKRLEPHLYSHLMANEIAPELHLTRWLRCMMSREFSLETSLKIWDFIFSGIEEGMIASFNA